MENINKKQALERLATIEKETADLRKIIDEKEKSWQDVVDFESACEYLGRNADEKLNKWRYADLSLAQINGLMLETCIEAINTENSKRWFPNWIDSNESKWLPRFEKTGRGWVVGCYGCGGWFVFVLVGFGGYYQTKEKAEHGAKHFLQYYSIWLR